MPITAELPIIQKTYDLIKWYVPILNRLPKHQRFQLGDRMVFGLYELLEGLILARYQRDKLPQLQRLNSKLDVLRYQTRLLLDFDLLSHQRYQYVGQLINGIGTELGGWIRQQKEKPSVRRQTTAARKSGKTPQLTPEF
ncbi:diversity-generating retroelement protein Avd [Leptothoe spongobia]|uniref:Diversity-generating retroelement protein Avd n=1 Tax=Leptothoe spongobia TAU-MAC 1115 TaxID=1967444 RepID=A0A947DJ44_9CYAN|nr:diversity-generating retroelement protein Avd [Leptothoe spongobia]MBT9317903.1 diversity-generating retroelement protein Avd [Leptothoe spongobia TAU-MAC 1115]